MTRSTRSPYRRYSRDIRSITRTRYILDYTVPPIVSFPDSTTHARKGSGDIGADSWFCKLSNHVIICIGLYGSTCGHVMVRKTKKTLQCPQTLFLACVVGSGSETIPYRQGLIDRVTGIWGGVGGGGWGWVGRVGRVGHVCISGSGSSTPLC